MMRVREALAGAALCAAIAVPAGAQQLFDLQKVADGVYAALATPRSPINCNAAVVVLDDAVLVVDTHSRPSSARGADRADPHAHRQAGALRRQHALPLGPRAGQPCLSRGLPEAGRDRRLGGDPREPAHARRCAPEGPARQHARPDRRPRGGSWRRRRTPPRQARLKDEIAQQKDYLAEIRSLELTLPDLTFDKSLIIHRGDRRSCCCSSVAGTPTATSWRGCRRSA